MPVQSTQDYQAAVHALEGVLGGHQLQFEADDRPLAKQLGYGVLRDYYRLCFVRDALMKKALPDKHLDLNLLLLCGIYSICSLKRPAHASVNATVEAAKLINKSWATGLVNGVLRNFIRRREQLEDQASNGDDESITNHPFWLVDELKTAWPDEWQDIVRANNTQAPMTLRVNRQQIQRDRYLQVLQDHGMAAEPLTEGPDGIQLQEPVSVEMLPGFHEGQVSVQDEASQLIAPLLAPSPGQRILDACAAPGGKACHLLEIEPEIKLLAIDRDTSRLNRVKENLHRLGLNCETRACDFLSLSASDKSDTFDAILLDAPCSATGTIRRHPDIKLLRDKADIAKLCHSQTAMLDHAWQLLKPGGILVYATCSILPQENEQVVSGFLQTRDDATVLEINIDKGQAQQTGHQLLPQINGHDGFFVARLRKASPA